MKNNSSYLLPSFVILLIVGNFIACEQETVNYALIRGEVTNTDASYVTVKGNDFSYDIDLTADGSFSDTLTIERGHYLFYVGRERASIFLEEGYNLDISVDLSMFDETLTFLGTGNGSTINNYLAEKVRTEEELTIDFQTLFAKNENAFIQSITELNSKISASLKSATIEDQEFLSLETKNLKYDYLTNISNYEYYHQYAIKDNSFRVSADFSIPLQEVNFNLEEDFKQLKSYQGLLQSYFKNMIRNGNVNEAFDTIRAIPSSYIKSELVPDFIYDVSVGNENAETIYNGIISISKDSATIEKLTRKIEKIRNLEVGMSSPKFSYRDINGEIISLESLNGNYVYVDVWATWCGPCLREIPSLKKLEEKYRGKNISFVSVSIDAKDDLNKWEKMVASKELKGIQLFADNSWKSDFVVDYAIDGIPRFILIDPRGNIIDANAPRPSEDDISELLNQI